MPIKTNHPAKYGRRVFSDRVRLMLTMLLLFFTGGLAALADGSVQIRVEGAGGSRIEVGSKFYLIYTVTNLKDEPAPPANVPGAKVNYFTLSGHSSSFTSVNGKTTSSVRLTYTATLTAQKEGTYTFGPVMVGTAKSNQIRYEIVPRGKGSASGAMQQTPQQQSRSRQGQDMRAEDDSDEPKFIGKGNDNIFLRASVSKTTAWQQEALVYTVKLYTTYSPIKFIGATDAPKFDGFVVEESDEVSRELTFETYNGREYSTAIIARYIIFPQMAGQLTIKGNTYTVSTDEREYYHDPYYQTVAVRRPIQLNVKPNDLTVNVKELPKPVPADFSGGVGQFSISSSFDTSKALHANEAASIVYTVKGTGNIKYVHLPDLNALYPSELEVYSPKTDVQAKAGANNVSGTARFDYSFMPMEEGNFRIPSVQLVYFNPATGTYQTTAAQGYDVQVGQGRNTTASQTRDRLKFDPRLMSGTRLSHSHVPYVYRFGYWLFYIVPFVLLAVAVFIYRKQLEQRADIVGLRSRKAGKVAAKRLRKAKACIASNDSHKFYEEMLAALWGYLGDKLKMPTSELSRENVTGVLESKGITEEDIKALVGVLDDCEMARYAPTSTGKTLQETYDQGAEVINTLEGAFKSR